MRPLHVAAIVGVGLVAGLALVGWLAGVEVLTTFGSGAVMQANVAIALIAAACALPLARGPSVMRRAVACLLGLVVVAVGAATAWQRYTGIDLGIDQWVAPGRVGIGSADVLIVLGVALLLVSGPRELHALGQWLALLVLLLAAFIGVGQALDIAPEGELFAIAPHTAVAACFVSGALCVLHPQVLPARPLVGNDAGGRFGRRLLPLAVIGPLAVAMLAVVVVRTQRLPPDVIVLAMAGLVALVSVGFVVLSAHRLGIVDESRRVACEAERLYGRIIEESPVGIEVWRPDSDGAGNPTPRLVASNPAAAALTGVERHLVIGKSLDELPYALCLGGVREAIAEVARTGQPREVGAIELPVRGVKNALAVRAFALPDGTVGVAYVGLSR